MANGIRTGDPRGFNKGRSSKFREGSRVRQTPEEGRRTYRPKRCGNNNKDEDNSPKNLNDKNQHASSQKFRQLITKEVTNISWILYGEVQTIHIFWQVLIGCCLGRVNERNIVREDNEGSAFQCMFVLLSSGGYGLFHITSFVGVRKNPSG